MARRQKTARNLELIKMRDKTGISFSKLGERFHISRQRSHKIYQNRAVKPCKPFLGSLIGKLKDYIKRLIKGG